MYNAVYSTLFSTVWSIVLGTIYRGQEGGVPQCLDKISQLLGRIGIVYRTVYSTVYRTVYSALYSLVFSTVHVCGGVQTLVGL